MIPKKCAMQLIAVQTNFQNAAIIIRAFFFVVVAEMEFLSAVHSLPLFSLVSPQASPGVEFAVRVSYVEVYKEEPRDLLEGGVSGKEVLIREDQQGNTGGWSLRLVLNSVCTTRDY